MPDRSMDEILDALGNDLLDEFDAIARAAHARYRAYNPADLAELDARAQANCTYCHMVAGADRSFLGQPGVRQHDIKGLKLWQFETPDVVVRFKKMDEDGRSKNYPTKQARNFDKGEELPGLPMPPVRLRVGYLLDKTGIEFIRTQIARPENRESLWNGAIIPREDRAPGDRAWTNVTRQGRL